jgi:hypothetical protein
MQVVKRSRVGVSWVSYVGSRVQLALLLFACLYKRKERVVKARGFKHDVFARAHPKNVNQYLCVGYHLCSHTSM